MTITMVPSPPGLLSIMASPFTCLANISIKRSPSGAGRAHAGRPDHDVASAAGNTNVM
jgi:hypothetical protein